MKTPTPQERGDSELVKQAIMRLGEAMAGCPPDIGISALTYLMLRACRRVELSRDQVVDYMVKVWNDLDTDERKAK